MIPNVSQGQSVKHSFIQRLLKWVMMKKCKSCLDCQKISIPALRESAQKLLLSEEMRLHGQQLRNGS